MAQLKVFPAKRNARNRPMEMNFMSENEIKDTINDEPVQFFFYMKNGRLRKIFSKPRLSLTALAMVSPVVHDAVMNSEFNDEDITKVILPYGDIYAYKDVLGWVMDMRHAGKIPYFRRVYKSPLLHYDRIQAIATKLGIGYLKVGMIRRINYLLSIPSNPTFSLDIDELRVIFTMLGDSHPLRESVAKTLREVNLKRLMTSTFCTELSMLVWELPSLQFDLYGHTFDRYRYPALPANVSHAAEPTWSHDVSHDEEDESENGVRIPEF